MMSFPVNKEFILSNENIWYVSTCCDRQYKAHPDIGCIMGIMRALDEIKCVHSVAASINPKLTPLGDTRR
jgi:hypothetical protein